jgi:hypothetical protein
MNLLKHAQLPGLDTMGLVLAVWLCALPFIGFLLVPVFGISAAFGAALALLIAMLLFCWGRCITAFIRFYHEEKKKTLIPVRTVRPGQVDVQRAEKGS